MANSPTRAQKLQLPVLRRSQEKQELKKRTETKQQALAPTLPVPSPPVRRQPPGPRQRPPA
jgi:hypothetical protein